MALRLSLNTAFCYRSYFLQSVCRYHINKVKFSWCDQNNFPVPFKKTLQLKQFSTTSAYHNTFEANNIKPSKYEYTEHDDILYRAIDILIKGHETSVLTSYMDFMEMAANHLDIAVGGKLEPKFIADRSTFLKSVHIYKKHRVQYEIRTYRRVLQLKYLTGTTADVYLEYVERNLPAGIAMHVHKWQLNRIPEHIRNEMRKNFSEMTEDDWMYDAQFAEKMKTARMTTNADYEEYHTTKRFLLGTTV